MVVALLAFGAAEASAQGLTQELFGYWRFDGNGVDSSGRSGDLTLYGSVGFGTGRFGQALNPAGDSTKYAQRPVDDAAFDFGSSDFTVQVWLNLATTSSVQTFVEKFDGAQGPGWTMYWNNGYEFYHSFGTVVLNTGPGAITSGTWHHVVLRRFGSDFQIFVDGAAATAAASSNGDSISDATGGLMVGRRTGSQEIPFNGLIDEVAIWRRALSHQEIASLWNGGAGRPVKGAVAALSIRLDTDGDLAGDSSASSSSEGSIVLRTWQAIEEVPGAQPFPGSGTEFKLSGLPAGIYTVTLTVKDSVGSADTASASGILVPRTVRTGDPGATAAVSEARDGLGVITELAGTPFGLRRKPARTWSSSLGPQIEAAIDALLRPPGPGGKSGRAAPAR